jgi:hypothetical protein
MDRRYYLAKLFLIALAVGLAFASGSVGPRMVHASAHQSPYSAPGQVQAATWHATLNAARVISCLVSRTVHSVA